jgi:hypothetical protein
MNRSGRIIIFTAIQAGVVLGIGAFGIRNAPGQNPPRPPPATSRASEIIETSGTFRSDRGDYQFTAEYWPDDGAARDSTGKQLLQVIDAAAEATNFDDWEALYTPESRQQFENDRAVKEQALANRRADPIKERARRITHVITVVEADKSVLYFVHGIVSTQIPALPDPLQPPGTPIKFEPIDLGFLDALRKRGTDVKLDLPSHRTTVYESLVSGEWDRFGLPLPDEFATQKPGTSTTKPSKP